jgi:Cdc6-like AAA superfamily ATPase
MTAGPEELKSFHKALIGFNKRAERVSDEILALSFVDSAPLFDQMATNNNQVIYGRRGTGKTHVLSSDWHVLCQSPAHSAFGERLKIPQ